MVLFGGHPACTNLLRVLLCKSCFILVTMVTIVRQLSPWSLPTTVTCLQCHTNCFISLDLCQRSAINCQTAVTAVIDSAVVAVADSFAELETMGVWVSDDCCMSRATTCCVTSTPVTHCTLDLTLAALLLPNLCRYTAWQPPLIDYCRWR